tara:strand:- start:499 stop:1104 length:606 start_codon:yes stop_codon:yes gene_type:complete
MKFQKLDLQNLQNQEFEDSSGGGTVSAEDELKIEENNNREQTITDLKLKLHDGFSHILGENKLDNVEEKLQQIEIDEKSHAIEANDKFIDEAKSNLSQIQDLAGISLNESVSLSKDEEENSPNLLLNLISELRILTEKRSNLKSSLNEIDNSLIKLQEKIYKNKKIYEDKIAHLESINEIYNQSADLVSKIISEDTKYEKL